MASSGSSTSTDPSLSKRLLVEGATFVFLDVPPRTEVGIDLNSWNVGDKFKGVKMIPPGIHFVYYSAVSREGQTAPRTGFFHDFKRGEILVKRYDKREEDVVEAEMSSEELDRVKDNIHEIKRYLGVYPYDSWKKWVSLTNHISEGVLENLQPTCCNHKISSASHLILDETKPMDEDECSGLPTKRTKLTLEERLLPKMRHQPGTEIRFTKIPEEKYPEGSTAAEITRHNMDLTYTLQQMLGSYTKPEDILGDLQMAFVCFLVGQVYDAFEQWKKLVNLLCSCEDALSDYTSLFTLFISTVHFQIQEVPKDFFVDIVSRTNFLTTTLHAFFTNLEGNPNVDSELHAKGKRFRLHLTKKFKWDFVTEPDEYAPVVVQQ